VFHAEIIGLVQLWPWS